jgi:hypothetical protein
MHVRTSGNRAASGEQAWRKAKPKKAKIKTIAANASQKGGPRGLENLKND